MKYRALVPIVHNGQHIPVNAVISDGDLFGVKGKSALDVAALVAKKRLEVVPEAVPIVVAPPVDPKTPADSKEGKKL